MLTVRDELRRRVRAAAAATDCSEAFVRRLARDGVRVTFRYSEVESGQRTGVKFALASDATAARTPVWYGGGRLAPELTWPKLCARWAAGSLSGMDHEALASIRDRDRVLAEAEGIVRRAQAQVRRGSEREAAAIGQAAADCLTAGAWLLDGAPDGPLVQAAERLDQATRQPRGYRPPSPTPDVWRLQVLAQALFALQLASDDDEERQALRMLYALCVLVERVARLRERQHRTEQAAHARAAAAGVRGWRRVSLRDRGGRLTPAERARYAEAVRQVLPERAGKILAEPAWDALAATMRDLQARGADVQAALRVVAGWRDLGTAVSVSELLVWRLRRRGMPDKVEPTASVEAARPRRGSTRPRRHTPTARVSVRQPGRRGGS